MRLDRRSRMHRFLVLIVAVLVICSTVLAAPPVREWKTNAPVLFPFGREGSCQLIEHRLTLL